MISVFSTYLGSITPPLTPLTKHKQAGENNNNIIRANATRKGELYIRIRSLI